MGKWNSSKVDEIQGFLYLGRSNRTISSVLSEFSQKCFHLITQPPIINHFLLQYPRERKGGSWKQEGQRMGKQKSSKVDETQGFLYLGHSNLTYIRRRLI